MATESIISGSRPTLPLMGRVWFNYNQVLSEFGFTFSNLAASGMVFPPFPDYILKIFFYYFILYFYINNNNNYNVF